jgi:hypothetical protein
MATRARGCAKRQCIACRQSTGSSSHVGPPAVDDGGAEGARGVDGAAVCEHDRSSNRWQALVIDAESGGTCETATIWGCNSRAHLNDCIGIATPAGMSSMWPAALSGDRRHDAHKHLSHACMYRLQLTSLNKLDSGAHSDRQHRVRLSPLQMSYFCGIQTIYFKAEVVRSATSSLVGRKKKLPVPIRVYCTGGVSNE